MNYFAHGRLFIDDPYFLAGTAIPDWLCVSDRGVKVRERQANLFVCDTDQLTARLARGICRHHQDDARFHGDRTFVELTLEATQVCRLALPGDVGFRPSFVGHVGVELLLDAMLTEHASNELHRYYTALDQVDAQVVHAAVERMSGKRIERLAGFIEIFRRERFLWDYADDGRLLWRLNQVMRRVRLPALPQTFIEPLATIRTQVASRWHELPIDEISADAVDALQEPA